LSDEKALQARLGHPFRDPSLLREALSHKSYSNEQPGAPDNERLEFLGDAVIDLVVSQAVFRDFPDIPEGELTRIRAEVVSEQGLAALARELELGGCLLLGKGEEHSGGREKESLLADVLEAVLGAVFCDAGYEKARAVIEPLFAEGVALAARRKTGVDHKTRLQVLLQGRHGRPPVYSLVLAEGPDHQRWYTVEVRFAGETIGRGCGRTKKAAEQEAAREALSRLED
jgi:ribonuclease-3